MHSSGQKGKDLEEYAERILSYYSHDFVFPEKIKPLTTTENCLGTVFGTVKGFGDLTACNCRN